MGNMMQLFRPNYGKRDTPEFKAIKGLITAVVQDFKTKEVLMVAYANEEALRKTLKTGLATFLTTSRGAKLWTKGEESGNFLKVVDIKIDCDGDSVLYLVEPRGDGVACHTGAVSCFYRSLDADHPSNQPPPKEGPKEKLDLFEAEVEYGLESSMFAS